MRIVYDPRFTRRDAYTADCNVFSEAEFILKQAEIMKYCSIIVAQESLLYAIRAVAVATDRCDLVVIEHKGRDIYIGKNGRLYTKDGKDFEIDCVVSKALDIMLGLDEYKTTIKE